MSQLIPITLCRLPLGEMINQNIPFQKKTIPFTLIYTFLISIFLVAAVLQLCFLFMFRLPPKPQAVYPDNTPVSLIICAKNEAYNLSQFLPPVLQQEYPRDLFEVIVVNDGSTDATGGVLSDLGLQYDHLRIITIDPATVKDIPGKKYALAKGIAAARFDRLLLTDADCRPSSPLWLQHMVAAGDKVVLGYGAYEYHSGLLNRFIRWETVHTCMQYAGYAAAGIPYMGVGRNLSYPKALLALPDQDEAFQEIYKHTPSGDDDLLVGKIARKDNTVVCLDKEAHTISVAQKTWKAWWRQKTRHASTGKYYAPRVKALLGLYGLSHSLYWFLGIPLLVFSLANAAHPASGLIVVLFLLRLLCYWFQAANWYRQLGEKKLSLFYPLGDLGWAMYNVFLSPYILWKNKQAWK